jgi:hypothetical protein
MSFASAYSPAQIPLANVRSSAASAFLMPPIAIRGSSSISRPNSERSGLLLGSSLLSDDPIFSAFFQEVKALQHDQEEDIPPDSQALAEVLRLVPYSRAQMAQRWFPPVIASDGYGGVRLTWRKDGAEIRAVISGAQTTRGSYLYWEAGSRYGTVPNFTATTLFAYLDRLEKVASLEW